MFSPRRDSWYHYILHVPQVCFHLSFLTPIIRCFCFLRDVCFSGVPVICSTWGQSQYRGFDGKVFKYDGSCDYVLAYVRDGAEVVAVNDKTCQNGVNCTRSVMIHYRKIVTRVLCVLYLTMYRYRT